MTPVVLAISSHVSASTVGLRATVPALQSQGAEAWPVPTVLYGLHPGWERRPGTVVEPEELAALLDAALVHPSASRVSWIMTGHFSSVGQIEVVLDAAATLRARCPAVKLLVDPIMGDEGRGLYVREDVAQAIADLLIPAADLITPNAWEAQRLAGLPAGTPALAAAAARALGRPAALITSVRADSVRDRGRIGAVYVDDGHALFAHAPEHEGVPNGTGDMLAASFLGARLAGAEAAEALIDSVRRVAGVIAAAEECGLRELPASAIASGAAGPAAIEAIH